ncbi:MAG TPA: hypothetical protein VKV30_06000 [Candidatus Angelobacter sp.]|nr:hypothetical protein [Candidatus Angelobacter sp.]
MRHSRVAARVARYGLALLLLSCGGRQSQVDQTQLDLCGCTPSAPDSEDFRHNQKHVPLPDIAAQNITVATMLTWPQTPVPAADAPRSGRELQLFHIGNAFVQRTFEVLSDCDIHLEISDVADKGAPRAIAEIPSDGEYCQTRQNFQAQLAAHNITIGTNQDLGEIDPALPIDITGLAFEDEPHSTRGSALVKTIWELHPAKVTLTQ